MDDLVELLRYHCPTTTEPIPWSEYENEVAEALAEAIRTNPEVVLRALGGIELPVTSAAARRLWLVEQDVI